MPDRRAVRARNVRRAPPGLILHDGILQGPESTPFPYPAHTLPRTPRRAHRSSDACCPAGRDPFTICLQEVSDRRHTEQVNPLLQQSPLPYGVPRFDQIRSEDFRAAFDEGMREELADVDCIAGDTAPPTFVNTLEALEQCGALLRRTQRVFHVLLSAHSDEALQKIDAEYSPKLVAHRDAITLNPQLYARVKSLYDRADSLGLDTEQRQLLEERYRNHVRAGAALSSPEQDTVRANNVARANVVAELRRRILAEVNAAAIV